MFALCVGCGGASAHSSAEQDAPPLDAVPDVTSTRIVEVRKIVIGWAGLDTAPASITRSEQEAAERAQTISALARSPGSNFGEVGREYGDRPPSIDRLERGTEASADLFEAAAALRVGAVSQPIRTAEGFVIVERRPDPLEGPAEVTARHILIAHVESRRAPEEITRTREEAMARAEELRGRALAGEDWDALHQEYTDEPNSPPGGDLGTFGRGSMVPSFEAAVFSLEVGGFSEIVETPFGFHLIQRTG